MRQDIVKLLLLMVVITLITACAPRESETIAALEATIAALEQERQEEGRFATQEPYPTPASQVQATPSSHDIQPNIIWTISGRFLIAEDRVFTMENISGGGIVRCFDMKTAEQLWQWEETWETKGRLLIADSNAVYVGRADGRYYAIDSQTGIEKWKVLIYPELGPTSTATQDANRLFLAMRDPELLIAINKADGSVAWWLSDSPLIARTDRVLVVGHYRGVDPATGQLLWELSERFQATGPIVDPANNVFFHRVGGGEWAYLGPIVAYDIDSGKELWRSPTKDLADFLKLSPTSLYAITSEWEPPLRVFNPKTGQERWTWPDIPPGQRHPSTYKGLFLGEFEGVIIISDPESGFTWALDATTGNVLWENDDLVLHFALGFSQAGTLVGLHTQLTGPGFLLGIDATSGQRKWRRELKTLPKVDEIIHHRGKFIYATTEGLVFLDPETGEEVTTLPVPCSVYSMYTKLGLLLLDGLTCLSAVQLP